MNLQHRAAMFLMAVTITGPQGAIAAAPDAGSILRQVQPVAPPALSSSDHALAVESRINSGVPTGTSFLVSAIRISGNTLVDTATLRALIQGAEGQSLTLVQLGAWAQRITEYYRNHDHPLTQTVIPAQTIHDGLVTIEVIEARYGEITIDNRSRVTTPLLKSIVSPQSGEPVGKKDLDRSLLLLADTPGVVVNATLTAGRTSGTSDLRVNANAGPMLAGSIMLDGHGNEYTGRRQIGGRLAVLNPLRHGDILSLRGLGSGDNLGYGSITYESLINGYGTRMGASYSRLAYKLGQALRPLDAHGTAQVQGLWARHTLVRGQVSNLYGQVQYNRLQLHDRIDLAGIRTDRHVNNWTASLAGDARDEMLSGGSNAWNVSWTSGRVVFDDAVAQMADAATAHAQGGYTKLDAAMARLQRLNDRNVLYMAFSGQWSDVNLDPSDKMTTGGFHGVRAYDVGTVSGDAGYLATLELRHHLAAWKGGSWQAIGFVDRARIAVNKKRWAPGTNRATLSGVGAGITFDGTRGWTGKASIAVAVGAAPVLEPGGRPARVWAELGRSF